MIAGVVNGRREATLALTLRGPTGATATVVTVIDTGYSGFLTVSGDVVRQLGLAVKSASRARLADGKECLFDMYEAEIDWDGHPRTIKVSAIGDEALAGMKLLAGCRLTIDIEVGGVVEIVPLSNQSQPPPP